MSDSSQDKKDTVPDVPTAKSYSTDGVTAEFDPGALQAHAISPELRQEISGAKLPRLDPKYLQDTAPPNRGQDAMAATTQPSLRRMAKALEQPDWHRRGLVGLVVVLSLAIVWELAVLVQPTLGAPRTSASASANANATADDATAAPRATVQTSHGARPRLAQTTEPASGIEPVQERETAAPQAHPAQTSGQPGFNRSPPAPNPAAGRASTSRNVGPASGAPPAPAPLPGTEPHALRESPSTAPAPRESGENPRPESPAAPQLAASSKPPSKVLFPPQ